MSLRSLAEYAQGEIEEIVATYRWRPVTSTGESYGVEIEIRVSEDVDGRFQAIPSHRVQTPRQATPYMSIHPEDSVEDAVRDCIEGFMAFMGSVEETTWSKNEYF